MVIETLTLKNLGVYAGEITIDLTPKSNEQPVILIGGLNGRGKTTMRNAILLCLHGSNAECTNRGNKGYNQYLASLISRSAKKDESTSVTLTYHRKVAGKVQRLCVSRCWENIDGSLDEKFTVHVLPDDKAMELDPNLANNWNEHIEGYFPPSLASLFFFDGEDIVRLSDQKEIKKLIESALNGLLGLNIIERLEQDLTRYIRQLINESEGSAEQLVFQEAEKELLVTSAIAERCQNEVNQAQKNFEKATKVLIDAEKKYADGGGKLLEKSRELQIQEIKLSEEVEELRDEFRAIAESHAFLLLVQPLLKCAHKQSELEATILKAAALAEHDEKRDQQIIQKIMKAVGDNSDRKKIEAALESTRTQKPESTEIILGSDEKLSPKLSHTISTLLPDAKSRISNLISKIKAKNRELEQTKIDLLNVPDSGAITLLKEKLDLAIKQNLSSKLQLDHCNERLSTAIPSLIKAQNAKENAEASFRGLKEIHTKKLRAQQARESIQSFKKTSTSKKLCLISELITDAFKRLVGKESLIKSIEVDRDTFELKLTNPDGAMIDNADLSAGERQILAYAVLWGLSKASGRPLPNLIDTPMGRLDKTHKMNIALNYFHQASHQVIILSTDSEIYGEFLDSMQPGIGHMYSLEFDENTKSTKVIEGYFR